MSEPIWNATAQFSTLVSTANDWANCDGTVSMHGTAIKMFMILFTFLMFLKTI